MSHDCFYFSISFSIADHADARVSRLKSIWHNEAIVNKEKQQDVVGSDEYRIHNVLDKEYQPLHTSQILQNADSLVGEVLPYNLLTRNCEHFATQMRYGAPQSKQVQLFSMTFYIRIILHS